MNTLSWLIYLAGAAGSLNAFVVFLTVIFGALAAASLFGFLIYTDETDRYNRPLPAEELTVRRERRGKLWRRMWMLLMLMTMGGVTASVIPERQTVLLIAASQMGEQVLNHPRINQVVDPGIELLTTWMQKETADLRRSAESNNRAR